MLEIGFDRFAQVNVLGPCLLRYQPGTEPFK